MHAPGCRAAGPQVASWLTWAPSVAALPGGLVATAARLRMAGHATAQSCPALPFRTRGACPQDIVDVLARVERPASLGLCECGIQSGVARAGLLPASLGPPVAGRCSPTMCLVQSLFFLQLKEGAPHCTGSHCSTASAGGRLQRGRQGWPMRAVGRCGAWLTPSQWRAVALQRCRLCAGGRDAARRLCMAGSFLSSIPFGVSSSPALGGCAHVWGRVCVCLGLGLREGRLAR